jgi:histidinol-phosphate/aromatic aminotransferase/cobyric acid decarboxylase-like protein
MAAQFVPSGEQVREAAMRRAARSSGACVAVLVNPNNPAGGYRRRQDVLRFVDALTDLDLVVVDESYGTTSGSNRRGGRSACPRGSSGSPYVPRTTSRG